MTTLTLDFGNTRLKAGIFHGNELAHNITLQEDTESDIEEIIKKYKPHKTILSSVINHNPAIETLLAKHTQFHVLNHTSKLPFTIPVGKPETVGADRLALCAAATYFYPNCNNLIIALGSCITYNFINQAHQFLGGSISPGLQMRFKAMHDYTALLPSLQPQPIFPLIGYDTNTNLQSGVQYGMAFEIDGTIAAYQAKFGNFNVILTGGNTAFFVPLLKNRIFADNQFIFKGLYAISQHNNV